MKTIFMKMLLIALLALPILSFTSCGDDEDKFAGIYTGTLDMGMGAMPNQAVEVIAQKDGMYGLKISTLQVAGVEIKNLQINDVSISDNGTISFEPKDVDLSFFSDIAAKANIALESGKIEGNRLNFVLNILADGGVSMKITFSGTK